jgi:DNA-binding NarL/FixJ family response regulator
LRPDRDPSPEWPFVAHRGDRKLVARRLPIPGSDDVALLLDEPYPVDVGTALRQVGLTPRQSEIMTLVTEGRSTKQIAQRLGISPRTVDKHVEHSLRTRGADSRLVAANLIRQIEARPT